MCVRTGRARPVLIEEEVASKSGLRGAALKAGYKAVKRIKPGIIETAVDRLLPEFAPAVDPFYDQALEKGEPLRPYFQAHAGEIADALLAITDKRAERVDSKVIRKAYGSLRGQAKDHTMAAVPRLADLIEKHAKSA